MAAEGELAPTAEHELFSYDLNLRVAGDRDLEILALCETEPGSHGEAGTLHPLKRTNI